MKRRDCNKRSKYEKNSCSHIDSTKFRFFKKMDASCLNKMHLPKDLNFKGRIAKNAKLKGPNGNIWQVGVTKLVEELTFQAGWKDFVIANSIKANDLLLFKCNSDSFFEVKIFHPSRCEGTSPFFVKEKRTTSRKTNKARNSSIRNLDVPDSEIQQDVTIMSTSSSSSDSEYSSDYVPIQKTRRRRNVTIMSTSSSSSDSEYSSDYVPIQKTRRRRNATVMSTSSSSSDSEYSSDYVPVQKTRRLRSKQAVASKAAASKELFVLPAGLQLTPSDLERTMQLSHGVEPGNKYFVTLMKFSHVNGKYLVAIPSRFAVKHLSRKNRAILHYEGRKWSLSIYYKYNSDLYPYFATGFKVFVEDNNLRIGDLCLFELMKNEDTVSFKVHISRN